MCTRSFPGQLSCLPRSGEEHKPTKIFATAKTGISYHHRRPRFPVEVLATTGRREAQVYGASNIDKEIEKKPRVLCLHGFRTSGEIMSAQMKKWPAHILDRFDLVFPDGPYPAQGPSMVECLFPPPYYEWFEFNQERTILSKNLNSCLEFLEEYMVEQGPFDGLLGFCQGAYLSGAVSGLQSNEAAFTRVPSIKFVILMSGGKIPLENMVNAYTPPINLPSLHFIGETNPAKRLGRNLAKAFEDPYVIYHPKGRTVTRLDEKAEKMVMNFIDKIQDFVPCVASIENKKALRAETRMLSI